MTVFLIVFLASRVYNKERLKIDNKSFISVG